MENLTTLEEWVDYISNIEPLEMIKHAKLIGSVAFQEEREQEGYDDDDIMAIYVALAKRFLVLDQRVPDAMENSCVNFRKIAAGTLVPQ